MSMPQKSRARVAQVLVFGSIYQGATLSHVFDSQPHMAHDILGEITYGPESEHACYSGQVPCKGQTGNGQTAAVDIDSLQKKGISKMWFCFGPPWNQSQKRNSRPLPEKWQFCCVVSGPFVETGYAKSANRPFDVLVSPFWKPCLVAPQSDHP